MTTRNIASRLPATVNWDAAHLSAAAQDWNDRLLLRPKHVNSILFATSIVVCLVDVYARHLPDYKNWMRKSPDGYKIRSVGSLFSQTTSSVCTIIPGSRDAGWLSATPLHLIYETTVMAVCPVLFEEPVPEKRLPVLCRPSSSIMSPSYTEAW